VLSAVKSAGGIRTAQPVGFARSTGFQATTAGSTQTTGPGVVLGLPAGYQAQFPARSAS